MSLNQDYKLQVFRYEIVSQVFAGDPRTEMMLAQLLAFFGPEAKKGLVMDGTLTCRQYAPRPVGVPRS